MILIYILGGGTMLLKFTIWKMSLTLLTVHYDFPQKYLCIF